MTTITCNHCGWTVTGSVTEAINASNAHDAECTGATG